MNNSDYVSERAAIKLNKKVKIVCAATAGGKVEKEGPLGKYLDIYCNTDDLKTGTFEKSESEMIRLTVNTLLGKAGIKDKNVDLMLGGDLMNQCTASAYGLCEFDIPYLGLYGACSTFASGLLTASILIDSGHISNAIVVASSHFCSAERQFRFPLEYGSVSGTTAQTTVTGCGAVFLSAADSSEDGIMIDGGMYGIVSDRGIKDAANMGAAMATAAADTILRYFDSSEKDFPDYDAVATGDLGSEGLSIAREMISQKRKSFDGVLCDCGEIIYDKSKQDVGCGGSGCGCSAVVSCAYFLERLQKREIENFALIGTGALMSPQSLLQGLSIPAVGHLVSMKRI